jgi:YggT family protein
MLTVADLTGVLSATISIYSTLLLIRIFLTWFPMIDWSSSPWSILSQLTDPYLDLFRSFLPTFGGIDFSPILALMTLSFLANFVALGGSSSSFL